MKNYILAIKSLPVAYVDDATRITEFKGGVIAVNPGLIPIFCTPETGWREIEFTPARIA